MMIDDDKSAFERVSTGIPGLDTVLRGGLLRGGVYIVQGVPGAGKTILANQFCFRHVASGGRAAFVTLLAESHTRMLQHLRPLDFFDESVIPESLYYVSGFNALENEGLKGLLDLLRREIRGHRATALVIDGFLAVEEAAPLARDLKKFVHEVQTYAAVANCTVLLLTNGSNRRVCPEHTMVDGLIDLGEQVFAIRTERSLVVRKFRGSGFLPGRHSYRIADGGMEVYPRIEAAFNTPSVADQAVSGAASTGVPELDEMLGGGLPIATTAAIVGPTGTGKTTLGLQFISRSSRSEPGLFFGFYETPVRLRQKSAALNIDLAAMEERGDVEIIWQSQGEHMLDELGHRLLESVRRRNVKRLFVDGLTGLVQAAVHPERIGRFFAVLANELRALGVTTLYTMELRDVVSSEVVLPIDGVSSLLENLIAFRYVEFNSRVHRLVSVIKVRDSDFDPSLREFRITAHGIEVGGTFGAREDVLRGAAHVPRPSSSGARRDSRQKD